MPPDYFRGLFSNIPALVNQLTVYYNECDQME